MASHRRSQPGWSLRRADPAPRFAVIAVGRRVARRILNATPPPTSRSARRATHVRKLRPQSLIPDSTRRERTPVQLVLPLIEASTVPNQM